MLVFEIQASRVTSSVLERNMLVCQGAAIRVCVCVCVPYAVASVETTLAPAPSVPPAPSDYAVTWSVCRLLSVAHTHVLEPLINGGSDSLIDRGQFMNIFHPRPGRRGLGRKLWPKAVSRRGLSFILIQHPVSLAAAPLRLWTQFRPSG